MTATGSSSSVTRIGCERSGTSGTPSCGVVVTGAHGPGSRRASQRSPISRSAYSIGPVVACHSASLAITSTLPSSCSRWSSHSSAGSRP